MTPQQADDKNLKLIKDRKSRHSIYYRLYRNTVIGALVIEVNNEEPTWIYPDAFPLLMPYMLEELINNK